jgi:phage baseplate assembly protein W
MKKEKSFLGKGWAFPPDFPLSSNQNSMVEAKKDIEQSLRILLGTTPGERVMHPEFGCGINKLVFEPISTSLFTKIKDLIEQAILLFESRIQLNDVSVQFDPKIEGVIYISIDYTIRSINTRQNLVYPFYRLEATNQKAIR